MFQSNALYVSHFLTCTTTINSSVRNIQASVLWSKIDQNVTSVCVWNFLWGQFDEYFNARYTDVQSRMDLNLTEICLTNTHQLYIFVAHKNDYASTIWLASNPNPYLRKPQPLLKNQKPLSLCSSIWKIQNVAAIINKYEKVARCSQRFIGISPQLSENIRSKRFISPLSLERWGMWWRPDNTRLASHALFNRIHVRL